VSFDPKKLDNFPGLPGVYLMKDAHGSILYIGKAKVLKARIKQYFVPGRDGRPSIPYLVEKIADIETIVVSSEKEALLLENTLIKQHQPKYNVLLKDDKSYISLKLTYKHEWPKLELVRYKGAPPADALYFGPYMNVSEARQLMDMVQKLFPLRLCSDRELARGKPCFFYQIKKCPGPCAGKCSKEEYDKRVKRTIQFLRGQDKEVLKALYSEMEAASDALEFEKSAGILRKIQQIEHALEAQQVHRILQSDCDALGLYREADEVALALLIFRGGKLVGSESYRFKHVAQNDIELFESFLVQHYKTREELPQEILLPIAIDKGPVEEVLDENSKRKVHILSPQRGNKLSIIEMAQANAKALFEKDKNRKADLEKILLEMQDKLRLSKFPRRIECFDNSHLSGSNPVSSMVVFIDGEKTRSEYRKYRLRSANPSDDYGALYEVLHRRFQKPKDLPDLLLIDGGKGQLNIALKVLEELGVPACDVVGVAKEDSRHDKGSTMERLFLPNIRDPVMLRHNSPLLFFIQQIRDEAHRFAITYQRHLAKKNTLRSQIDTVPGIGPVKQKRLLTHFGSVKRIRQASSEEWLQVKGITAKDVANLTEWVKVVS
jgi:excinuclease ABC subunit C